MKTKAELQLGRVGTLLRKFRGGMAATLLLACGGALGEPQTSGESHFLRRCDDSCGPGLTCIANVCTRSCLVGKSSCSDLSAYAMCTDQSIEPGQVAVCDQACMQDTDCAALGTRFTCEAGFCRGAKLDGAGGVGGGGGAGNESGGGGTPVGGGGGAGNESGGGGTGNVSGGGGTGNESGGGGTGNESGGGGTGNVSGGGGTGNVSGGGGISAGGQAGGGAGGGGEPFYPAVIECPANVTSDPLTVVRKRFRGNVFDMDVIHGGGCATHDYVLCYGPAFLESYPVQTQLRLIHNAHGDVCDAAVARSLHFDLKPLADAYTSAYGATSGIISTSFGMYSFGTPSCEERNVAASSQVGLAVEWAQAQNVLETAPMCVADTECKWVSTNTTCSVACGAGIGNSRADDLAEGLAAIDSAVCGDFAGHCPGPALPPCAAPRPLACTNGLCADAM